MSAGIQGGDAAFEEVLVKRLELSWSQRDRDSGLA